MLDGALHLPQVAVGYAQVAQPDTFIAAVADLAGDGQRLGVVLDGTRTISVRLHLPQVDVGIAQAAQMNALAAAVADLAGDGEGGLQPGNPLLGVQAQIEAIGTGVGEISRQTRGRGVALPAGRGPGLPHLDVGAFQVEQGQAAQDVLTPFEVEVVGDAEHGQVMGRVAVMGSLARRFVQAGRETVGGEQADQVVQGVAGEGGVPGDEAVAQQLAERFPRLVLLQCPDRGSGSTVEGGREDGEHAP